MLREEYQSAVDQLRPPSKEALTQIAKDHCLNPEQGWELNRCVTGAIENIQHYARTQSDIPPRGVRLDRARKIAGLLAELETELTRGKATISHIAPIENLGVMGSLLSFGAFAELAPELKFDELVKDFVAHEEGLGIPVTVLDLERHYQQSTQIYDLDHRADILIFLAQKMRQQFDPWIAESRAHRGGQPRNFIREIMLFRLASDASRIIGQPPTTAAGGKFEKLCVDVFVATRIDCSGIEDAIRRILRDEAEEISFWNSDA